MEVQGHAPWWDAWLRRDVILTPLDFLGMTYITHSIMYINVQNYENDEEVNQHNKKLQISKIGKTGAEYENISQRPII